MQISTNFLHILKILGCRGVHYDGVWVLAGFHPPLTTNGAPAIAFFIVACQKILGQKIPENALCLTQLNPKISTL
tara:strand:- start:368 stop:592 length:225 start_codon:yes stop_codon:yes gene_type:complete